MARRRPVAFFLGDTAFLADPKFRALARRLPDPDDFNSAVGAFFIALASSRRNGTPDMDVEGETASRFIDDLRAVRLLNGKGFNEASWNEWGTRSPFPDGLPGGLARVSGAERTPDGRFAPVQRGPAEPAPSSAPASPAEGRGVEGNRESTKEISQASTAVPAREIRKPKKKGTAQREPLLSLRQLKAWGSFNAPEWQPFKKAWLARGFLWPPEGTPDDDDTSQRGLLWQIADARPKDLGMWIAEAPGKTTRQVIDYALARWHEIREVPDEEPPTVPTKQEAAETVGAILARLS